MTAPFTNLAWLNLGLMIANGLASLWFYRRSAAVAAREARLGEKAYAACARDRRISAGFMVALTVQYPIYFFLPLPVLPRFFPWPWWVGLIVALAPAYVSFRLLGQGMKYAGRESMAPTGRKRLFSGIYRRIRHPQAAGEMLFFTALALALHSPGLLIASIYVAALFYAMCRAEEKDLLVRLGPRYQRYMARTGMFLPRRRSTPSN